MRFKIVTDSGCDLSAEMIEALDLGIAALSVELDGRAYAEGEMPPKALYDNGNIVQVFPMKESEPI